MASAEASGPRSNLPLGLTCALFAATLYAVATLSAALAYDAGSNPGTVIWLRFAFSTLTLGLLAATLRRRLRPARRDWPALFGIALGAFGTTNGYLTSVAFIPISLAVLIFYTFPLLVGIAEPLLERRPIGLRMLACSLLAFVGLALALGPSFESLDWRGILLAAVASASGLIAFLSTRRLSAQADSIASSAVTLAMCWLAMSLLLPLTSAPALPDGSIGWLGLAAAALLFMIAYLLQLLALRLAPAGPVALIFNAEPALTVVLAWAILSQSLDPVQAVGVVLVVLALVAAALLRRRQPRAATFRG
jgi:drug/metabolite transporter (DMT)-like permease